MSKEDAGIIRDEIRALTAYHVPASAGLVKLDAMENPYRLPPELRERIAAITADAALNRYPDPAALALVARLRSAMRVPQEMQLLLGNGSDELIQMLALAVARPGAVMLGLEPSFAMFRLIAVIAGLQYVGVPLNPDFTLDSARTVAAINAHRPALIFIAYPNNPSGNLFRTEAIEQILAAAPGIVVIDEAYHAFAGASFMSRLGEFSNLLVMRTVSKLGLAGLRLGLLAGHSRWLQQIDKVRLPYNVNILTQRIAAEVLERDEVLASQAAAIRADRAHLLSELRRLRGVEPYASDANFILFRVGEADRVFSGLKQRGVLIKNLHGSHPLLGNCLRVTVGTPAENARFVQALVAALEV